MNIRKIKLKRGVLKIYIPILFIVVYGLIVLLYPKERKFAYEFQLGAPWMHEDLIAEYDFPILKSADELNSETDSVRRTFVPYYISDTSISISYVSVFKDGFNKEWKKFWEKNNVRSSVFDMPGLTTKPVQIKDSISNQYLKLLSDIYEVGIINIPDSVDKNTYEFQILKDGLSYSAELSELYQVDMLGEYVKTKVKYNIPKYLHQDSLIKVFINDFAIGKYVKPNLVYDKETNQRILDDELNAISLTNGLVQKGELIIQQGGIVDEHSNKVLQSLKQEYENSANVSNKELLFFGISLLYLATALALFLFLLNFKPKILGSVRKITFILLQVLLFTGLALVVSRIPILNIYIIPFAILPIVINTFFDSRTALFVHILVVLMVGFVAPNGFEFVFIQIIAGIVAVFSLSNIQQRKKMFVTAFYVLLAYALLFFSMQMLYGGGLTYIKWVDFAWFAGSSIFILFTTPLIWVSEKLFGFISDLTLVELTDTNNPLLRQLAEKAPGTFQHSLQVGNLAEAVCREIGGNPLLVRAGAMYHDVGKLVNPQYFIENQAGNNPHDGMEFDESAKVIISHVPDGVALAKKYNVPASVIDFIKTHHGTSQTLYFYRSFINKFPAKKVDISAFTYPGPSPRIIEHAILMMADAVEASTRSLKSYTEENVQDMVNKVVDGQLNAGQFAYVDITFLKITKAKRIFTEKLLSIYHARIEYPELKKKIIK